jgi:hypothetical protein
VILEANTPSDPHERERVFLIFAIALAREFVNFSRADAKPLRELWDR